MHVKRHKDRRLINGLGPNGALKYCMNTLCRNREWLLQKILDNKDKYIIIDCPGQLELYKSEGELWKVSIYRKRFF
ncbi:hypothetical protein COOONC_09551 [Cooperia oncophora]